MVQEVFRKINFVAVSFLIFYEFFIFVFYVFITVQPKKTRHF